MAPLTSSTAALVLGVFQLSQPILAATVDTDWYAPSKRELNNLTQVLDGKGVYDFIYDTSDTPDELYGTYNWCNMPHVRRKEYRPAKEGFELRYVELIQRHHKRTPYSSNAFPVEPYTWNCDDSLLHFYGEPLDGPHSAARAYRQGTISSINPFVPKGWIGSCQFPQITAGGLDDSWQHGKDLYEVYGEMLGFLPAMEDQKLGDKVKYRATNNLITHQVAGMLINGMWGTTDPFPLLVQATDVDSLEPQYSCARGSDLFNRIKSSANPDWQKHLDLTKSLYSTLDNISGVPSSDSKFHSSFDSYYDNLSARQCHAGKPLPCKLVDGKNSSTCFTQELTDTVYRLGHWEYSQMYRDSSDSLAASIGSYGVWVAELAAHLREAVAGTSETLYFHNVAHDGSVSRLLSILQLDEMVWPGMGSEVVFELYEKTGATSTPTRSCRPSPTPRPKSESGYYVRVLFGGQILKSSNPTLGRMDMIPIETLLGYFDGLVGEKASKVKSLCG
ncbi:Histidine acid phosphatase family protein [Sarocladium implicatum]|nr:Histidine acid phosphatase family protein [Sarocladium implicatum]